MEKLGKLTVGAVALGIGLAVALVVNSLPDINRYRRIRQM